MRTLNFCFLLLCVPLFAKDFDVKKIAAQVKNIKTSNKLSPELKYQVYDPFASAKPILREKNKKVIHKKRYKSIIPQTILNSKVFIEKKWYSIGDVFRGYKIKNIKKRSVLFYKNGIYKKIYLKSSKSIVKIEERIK